MSTGCDWEALLNDWFGDTRRDPARIGDRMAWWFQPDAKRDAWLEARHLRCCEAARAGLLSAWQGEPLSRLALILLLDQLPRNLYRGSARAFGCDHQAAMLCLAGVATGMDRKLLPVERVFFYMPLQHAEDLAAQEVSVGLYEKLAAEQAEIPAFEGCADYARAHRDIVARFGRFPHRNDALARTTTVIERKFLDSGGQRFGQ